MKFESLLDLITKINTESKAIAYFIKMRWKNEVKCPYFDCKANEFNLKNKIYHFSNKKEFKCSCCKRRFSYKTGTFLENSKISMKKWLMAMYIFTAHKKGISSVQLGKDIKVKQPTAWFILQRLREASNQNFGRNQFEGINEIDEAYIGGKEGNRHMKDRLKGIKEKAVVLGMVNRNSKEVKLFKVDDNKYSSLGEKILKNIKEGSTIITDELSSYSTLKMFYEHETINHSQGEYVKKDSSKAFKITTNSIEGVFGLFKRSVYGTFHWISKKHLQRYLAEFQFRFSNRQLKLDSERMELLLSNLEGRITYKNLIA